MAEILSMGIDIGSTTSKCAIMKNGEKLIGHAIVQTGTGTDGPTLAVEEALSEARIKQDDISKVIATGYGRSSVTWADKDMSELSCHAKGASWLFPEVKTVIDIGGQDSKVLHVSSKTGKATEFLMNDKCAAGTGRFLDVMARVLNVPISDFYELHKSSKNHVDISSTCTVFAETEVISHLSHQIAIEDIIAGIHRSISARVGSLAKRLGIEGKVVMTGGVSRDLGIVEALEEELDTNIEVSEYGQLAGAIGAAIYAFGL